MVANILEYLEHTTSCVPDTIAFYDDDRALTYGQLLPLAKAVGSFLAGVVRPRGVVCILMDGRSLDCIPAFLGTAYAGCAYAPLDPAMPPERLELILSQMQPNAVLTDSRGMKALAGCSAPAMPILSYAEAAAACVDETCLHRIRRQSSTFDPLSILYTSGSTGTPKGSIQCHTSYTHYTEATIEVYGFDQETVFASQSPFFYANSIIDIYPPIALGATVYLLPASALNFPKRFIQSLREHRVTELTMTPSSFQAIVDGLSDGCLPELRWCIMSGERMAWTLLKPWMDAAPGAGFYNFYGSTEAFSVAVGKVEETYAAGDLLPVGKPFAQGHIVFLDENGQETDPQTGGEMLVANPWLSAGYHRDPQRTAESFLIDPLGKGYFERFYRTGDIGRLDARGELFVLGRKDSQIKHHGYRMELGEVENALRSLPGWKDGCVLFDKGSGQLYCFFTGNMTVKAIQQALRKKLPRYMHPDSFVWLEQLPHTATMKIDRMALQKTYMI